MSHFLNSKSDPEVADISTYREFIAPFNLHIRDLNNNFHIIMCQNKEHTISYIKFVLSSKRNVHPDEILLYLNDKQLSDFMTLREYNIDENTTLRMFYRMKTGFNLLV